MTLGEKGRQIAKGQSGRELDSYACPQDSIPGNGGLKEPQTANPKNSFWFHMKATLCDSKFQALTLGDI